MTDRHRDDKPAPRVLLLPGWQDSGPAHWQTLWAGRHGDTKVEQDDWFWPRRGDWMAQLEHVVLSDPRPAVLVAHSLGCHLVDAWAGHSAHTEMVTAALLVAPPDLDRDDLPPQLAPWRRQVRLRLPFPSTVVYSSDDVYCSADVAERMAGVWGAGSIVQAGARGHLNGESGLGEWPEGRALLDALRAAA